jgi:hypothetical protein
MKKILLAALALLILAPRALAIYEEGQEVEPNGDEVRIMNQQGGEEEVVITSEGEEETAPRKEASPRSERARERMSVVAQRVEEILLTQGVQGGIGDQVRQVAREQKLAQEEMQLELNKIENRGNFLKRLIGPNYGAIKRMERQVEQNQLRIQQLTQLQTQLTNQAEITQVEAMLEALWEQNTALQERMDQEEDGFSLLGWLFKRLA